VTSTVILDHEKNSRSVEVKTDPKPVPIRTLENSRTSNKEQGSTGGAPGMQAQGGGANQPASVGANGGKGTNETSEETKNETVSVVSQTSTEKETFGLTPKLARVSVGIPASYYDKVWKERNPAKEGEEAKKPDPTAIDQIRDEVTKNVQATVANLLPTGPDVKDPTSLVTVTTFQDIKTAELPAPAATQRALTWLGQNWPMMAMVGLVLFSLGMLRSMLRSVPAAPPESAAVSMRVTGSEPKPQESEEAVEVTAARRLRRMTGSGPSLRDELSELVKEDPDSAANVLRSWIGQVS
jgi:flagellar M-ring protein FliF